MVQKFANNAETTLASSLASSDTTITLQTGHGALFPAISGGDYFLATLDDGVIVEIVKCTARVGDVLTVVRSQEDTVAPPTFAAGTNLALRITRDTLNSFVPPNIITSIAAIATTGLIAITAAGVAQARTITGTTNQITVTNGDGVAGNPVLSLPQNIHTAATPTFAGLTTNATLSAEMAPALNPAYWTLQTGWSITNGILTKVTGTASNAYPTPALTIVAGRTYKVVITVDSSSVGANYLKYTIGGVSSSTYLNPGTITDYITAQSSANFMFTDVSINESIAISYLSIKELSPGTGGVLVEGPLTVRSTTNFINPVGFNNSSPIAPIHIVCTSADAIRIQRLNVPTQYLAIYQDAGTEPQIRAFGEKPFHIGNNSTLYGIHFRVNTSTVALELLNTGVVNLPQTTASTSATTGSLVNAGGFGNAGAINAGGNIVSTLGAVMAHRDAGFRVNAVEGQYVTFRSEPSVNGAGMYLADPNASFWIKPTAANSATSGSVSIFQVLPNYNQGSGTASNTDLLINRTQTAVGSGAQRLFDAQVGGVSKSYIRNDGWFFADGGAQINNILTNGDIRYVAGSGTNGTFPIIMGLQTSTNTAGAGAVVKIAHTYNQVASTAANTDLLINRTETSIGSGLQYLIQAQVGGVSKFSVSNTGATNASDYIQVAYTKAFRSLNSVGTSLELLKIGTGAVVGGNNTVIIGNAGNGFEIGTTAGAAFVLKTNGVNTLHFYAGGTEKVTVAATGDVTLASTTATTSTTTGSFVTAGGFGCGGGARFGSSIYVTSGYIYVNSIQGYTNANLDINISGGTSRLLHGTAGKLRFVDASNVSFLETNESTTHVLITNSSSTTALQLAIKAIAAQSSNLQEWQNSSGTAIAKVSTSGALTALALNVVTTTADSYLTFTSSAGYTRGMLFTTGGSARWQLFTTASAESTGDAGSNFGLNAYTDAGAYIDSPISITRAAGGTITLSRPIAVSGNGTFGTASAAGNLLICGPAATNRRLYFRTGLATSRWTIGAEATAESGTDAGSGFVIDAFTDAGAYIDTPFWITRVAGGSILLSRPLAMADAKDIVLGTTTGTKIGTSTTQKLGFFNATPIVQPANTTDLRTALINLGFLASGGATPLNLNGGAFTTSGLVTNTNTTEASSHTAAAEVISGGLAVGKRIASPKMFITEEGGFAVRLTAGEALVRGEVVYIKQTSGTDGNVFKNPVSGDMPVGVVFQDAALGAEVVVITTGVAYVLPQSAITATRGYVIYSSGTTAGRVDQAASAPATTTHFQECGHFLDTGAGAGLITRALIHFN